MLLDSSVKSPKRSTLGCNDVTDAIVGNRPVGISLSISCISSSSIIRSPSSGMIRSISVSLISIAVSILIDCGVGIGNGLDDGCASVFVAVLVVAAVDVVAVVVCDFIVVCAGGCAEVLGTFVDLLVL